MLAASGKTAKCLGVAAVMVAMASCSQDVLDDVASGPTADLTKTEVVVNNNSAELSKRVTMYGKTAARSRAAGDASALAMPEAPASPAYDYEMGDGYHSWEAKSGKTYYLPAGKSLETQVWFNDNVYYVAGELVISSYYGKGKLVVLPGGQVRYPSQPLNDIEVLNYGEFRLASDKGFTVNNNAVFMTSGDFSLPDGSNIGGTFYVGNDLEAEKLILSQYGARFHVGNSLTADEVQITNSNSVYVGYSMSVSGRLELNSSSDLYVGCGLEAGRELYVTNRALLYIGSYLSSPVISMDSQSLLEIKSGSLVETGALYMKNPCTVTTDGDDYAVVSADKIEINQPNVKDMFTGWLDIHYKEIDNRSGSELEWLSNIRHNGDTYLPAAGCHPSFGERPAEPGPGIVIDHIAQVETSDHGHYISATCIQTVGDKAYVSYHTRGSGYHGCVEVLNVASDENVAILSFMEHPSLDFNHLIVDGDRIVAAGDSKNGAFLGVVGLGGGIFQTGTAEMTRIGLEGASTNCLIRNGSYFQVATNTGYYTLDANTFVTMAAVPTAGSSKFIHTDGASIGVLSLSDNNNTQSMAQLNQYGASDYGFASPVHTVDLDMITPVNGKNVLNVDGNDVYVCLGANGVKRYTNGTETASFKVDDDVEAAANGLAVDGRYVYVAYGHGGLFVLDKSDLSVVASYRYAGGKSANYVTVSGDILYVAYGLSGVQIFKLVEK
ncbi:MAG: hypothetical protein C7K11_05025 [Candidatus Amulumruptor caecigallinarius]|nr:MAG: hypothetical protein C7K11_05025 [Candidatus Amulumruptor caecigallinarius]